MKSDRLEANFKKLYWIKAIRSGMFSIPVIMLFFKENGLTTSEAIALQTWFSLAALLFEVPTGQLADRFGRKKLIILGSVLSACGYVCYALSHGYGGFLWAEIILAFGCSCVSGADSALMYDTLKELELNSQNIRNEGQASSVAFFSEGVTSFIGGSVLALVSLRLPICFDAALAFSAIPIAFSLVETRSRKERKIESSFVAMWRLLKHSLHDHKEVKWLIFFSAGISAATLNMVWFIQIHWVSVNVPIKNFGILWALLQFFAATAARNAHEIENFFGKKKSLLLIAVLPIAGYFLLGAVSSIWSIFFIFLFYLTRGINDPIVKGYLNSLIESENRATVLSVKGLVGRLMFCIIGPAMGYVNDTFSLQATFFVSGIVFLTISALTLSFLHKHKVI
jgi:MFS family permease